METIRKVSCSIIYFLMFAKSKFLIFLVVSVSLSGSTRLAVEDGCNSGYCFGASGESFVSKISVFSNMMFCWFMSWSSSVQVYNRFTRDFCGYCVLVFFLTTHEVKILVSSLINFLVPFRKKPIAFNYSTVWSSLIIYSRLKNATDYLKFNIRICYMFLDILIKMGHYSLIVYRIWPDFREQQGYGLLKNILLYGIWCFHPNILLLFLTLGLPSNQRHCNIGEHFYSKSSLWAPSNNSIRQGLAQNNNDYCTWHGHNISFPKFFFIAGSSCFYWTALSRKQSSHIRVKIQ